MLELYNTLTRQKEQFKPIKNGFVGLYTCGPTVYNYAHLGNLRTYIFEDILKRVLLYNGYKVKHVMNITDVGHLTGDRDMGEDKLEKEATLENKSAWDIAKFYTNEFKKNLQQLNIIEPKIYCKATDHIKEQIKLIQILEKKGFTYKTSDGIYFDTSKFASYNKLSHQKLENLQEGARVEKNNEKKNPTDFALWKFSPTDKKRQMEWASPWEKGFPGWHIECSAMSMKYLGKYLDIHCGGVDHINIHHTNEIAQSEAATGKQFFNYWMHGEFLNISSGEKMAKSEGNFLTLEKFNKQYTTPLTFRFATFLTHYRKAMEYSENSMRSAERGLDSIYREVFKLDKKLGTIIDEFKQKFFEAINNDLNMPQAIAVLQNVLKSNYKNEDKLATVLNFDKIFGLGLDKPSESRIKNITQNNNGVVWISDEVKKLAEQRLKARNEKNWAESDRLRDEIKMLGYEIEDTKDGYNLNKK